MTSYEILLEENIDLLEEIVVMNYIRFIIAKWLPNFFWGFACWIFLWSNCSYYCLH